MRYTVRISVALSAILTEVLCFPSVLPVEYHDTYHLQISTQSAPSISLLIQGSLTSHIIYLMLTNTCSWKNFMKQQKKKNQTKERRHPDNALIWLSLGPHFESRKGISYPG
jgi:hypothetical protein